MMRLGNNETVNELLREFPRADATSMIEHAHVSASYHTYIACSPALSSAFHRPHDAQLRICDRHLNMRP